jgi:hypothetical protein
MNQLRRDFHQAVALVGGRCLLLDASNDNDGFRNWSPEMAAGQERAYCVDSKPHLVVGDFDQCDGIQKALRCAEEMQAYFLSPVVLSSGGDGRAHLWVATDRQTRDTARALLKAHEADDRTEKRMRPPFSPHAKAKSEMALLLPDCPAQALDSLAPVRSRHASSKAVETPQDSRERYLELLETRGKNRSDYLFGLACRYASDGFTESEFIDDVMAHPQGAGHKFFYSREGRWRPRARHKAEEYLSVVFQRASERVANQPSARRQIAQMMQASSFFKWGPRENIRPTLNAIHQKAFKACVTTTRLSVRQVAELAGIPRVTAHAHLKKLIAYGWLEVKEAGTKFVGAVYEMRIPPDLGNGTVHFITPQSNSRRLSRLEGWTDALWGKGSLKQVALYLLECDEGMSVGEIAGRMNRRYESVRQALHRLRLLGLVNVEDGIWSASIDESTLLEVAYVRRTQGLTDKLRKVHRIERDNWQAHLSEIVCSEGLSLARVRKMLPPDVYSPTTQRKFLEPSLAVAA